MSRSPSDTASGTCSSSKRLAIPTIDDESMPPDRQVPAGTSATRRRSTDRSKRARNSAGSAGASVESVGVQYVCSCTPSASTTAHVAAASARIPANAVCGLWSCNPCKQVVVEPLPVGRGLELGIGEHGLGLGREQHASRPRARVVERLDAVVVAGEHQAGLVAGVVAQVEDGERPHAVEAGEAVGPPLQVRVQHHLGVARGVEGVAERFELGPQLAEVVDLAVVGELHRAVVGADRLVTTGGVDDREAAVAEAGQRVLEEPLAVGAAVGDPAGHGGQEGGVGRAPEPGNATHGRRSLQGTLP